MKKKTILVTGGAGYIGSLVCKNLALKNFIPVCYDNLSEGHLSSVKWGPFVKGDLLDYNRLKETFRIYQPVAVMHFAAKAYVVESILNPCKYYENNVTGSINLLKVMREENVHKIVFSSTCATYGASGKLPLCETHSQNPINPYGETKKIIEKLIFDFGKAHFFKSAVLRYFNAAGADLDNEVGENHNPETHLIPITIEAALGLREKLTIYGSRFPTKDGTAIRDYIHIQDLAEAHLLSLEWLLAQKQNLVLNLGTEKGSSIREIIQKVEEKTKAKVPVEISAARTGEPAILIADCQRAKSILNWRPKYSDLDTIIETALKWHMRSLKKANFAHEPFC